MANTAATTAGVIGQEENLEQQQQHLLLQGPACASAALAATTDAQLGALQARLKLFAARALGDWGLVLERRRLRRAWSVWVVQAWD